MTNEAGSDFAPGLDQALLTHHVRKGMGVPAYSAFEGVSDEDRPLADLLRSLDVTEVDVVGLATDHCVRATALDGRQHGFGVRLLPDLHAGVAPGTTAAALDEMRDAGVEIA